MKKLLINLLLAAALVLGTWFAANAVKAMAPKAEQIVPETLQLRIAAREVRGADFLPRVTAYGRVRAERSSLVSANLPGTVVWVHPALREGALLDSGTVVVRLDASRIPAQLERLSARRAQVLAESLSLVVAAQNTESLLVLARHNLELAVIDLKRSDDLLAQGKLSVGARDAKRLREQEYRSSLVTHQNALKTHPPRMREIEAQLRVLGAELALLERDIDDHEIAMPFTGHIVDKNVAKREQVQPGSPLFRVSDLDVVEVLLEVPVRERAAVRIGATVELSTPAFEGWQGQATVARLGASVDPRAGTVTAFARAAGEQGLRLSENLFLRGDILGETLRGQICLPRHLVQRERVFVIDDEVVRERRVEILHRSESEYVVRGLRPGERIAASHLEALYEGCPVEVAE